LQVSFEETDHKVMPASEVSAHDYKAVPFKNPNLEESMSSAAVGIMGRTL
jgi:hypothetical protein